MVQRQKAASVMVILFLSLNIVASFFILNSDEVDAWEFGGLKEPKTSWEYPVGESPQSVFVIDVNDDTYPDIITLNQDDNSISVLIGDGKGEFTEHDDSPIELGTFLFDMHVADIDNDTYPDIIASATVGAGEGEVIVLVGDGEGKFQNATSSPFSVGDNPRSIFVADINNDTHTDIITANAYVGDPRNDNVSILVGDGTGDFPERIDVEFNGEEPTDIHVIDINQDTELDVVIVNANTRNVAILQGNGDLDFTQGGSYSKGRYFTSVYVDDVNDDHHPDIIASNKYDNSVTIMVGDGDGNFRELSGSPFGVGFSPSSVSVADVNADGIMDILTTNKLSHNVTVLFGDGNENYYQGPQGPLQIHYGPSCLFLADLNGDNHLDIVTANSFADDVSVLLGHDNGYFFNPDPFRVNIFETLEGHFGGKDYPYGIAVSEIDIDGYQYIVVTQSDFDSLSVFYTHGSDEFEERVIFHNEIDEPYDIVTKDINSDGFTDILTANRRGNTVTLLVGSGAGSFTIADTFQLSGGAEGPECIFISDVNRDTNPDIVTANAESDDVSVFLGDGRENFTEAASSPFQVGNVPLVVFISDMNNDDNPDIITANGGDDTISILLGNGLLAFNITGNVAIDVGDNPRDVFVADFNKDDNMDIITPNSQSDDVTVLFGDGSGAFPTEKYYYPGLQPTDIFVSDLNDDENADFVVINAESDEITIMIGSGDGSFLEAEHSPYRIISEPRALYVANIVGSSLPDIITTSNAPGFPVQVFEVFLDYDYDGAPDEYDLFPTNPTEWQDFDRDMIGNNSDMDDDNDGVADINDRFPFDDTEWSDIDDDKIGDNTDPNIDGDPRGNEFDAFPFDPSEWLDTDGDGIGDNTDEDMDGDNYTNTLDVFPENPREWNDTDGDGKGDNEADDDIDGDGIKNEFDAFPFKGSEWSDTDGDGIGDNTDDDIDGDGVTNEYDRFRYDKNESMDADNDGKGDNSDDDIDGDNVTNEEDMFPFDVLEFMDTDGDGKGDNADLDDDNDHYLDTVEIAEKTDPLDNTSIPNDVDGDYIPDSDEDDPDNDGYVGEADKFPLDVTEWADLDNDGIGDNADTDKDGDGYADEDDAFPWDDSKWEEEEDFIFWKFNISGYHQWLMRVFIATILLALYAILSTTFVFLMKRGILVSGLFVFQKSRKVPYYKKEIRKADSILTLNYLSDRIDDELDHQNISQDQYASIREEADKRRIALTYAVLGSLTPEQQLQIFNDMISRDEKFKEQLADTTHIGEGAGIAGEAATGAGAAAGTGAMAAGAKTSDVSGKNIDKVHFTVTAPPKVTPESTFLVDLWAHMEEQMKEVIEQARMMAEEEELTVRSVGPKPIARGTVLTARLRIEDMVINEAVQTILWEGEIGNANYAVKVPEDASLGSKQGTADILIDGLKIAVINFIIKVAEESEAAAQVAVEEKRIETAFASYARLDRDEVLPRIQGIQKAVPSMNIFLDILSLRSGQNWDEEIHRIIPARDIFYLFWSENARKSHWVEVEWRCALETRGIDFIDPVPLVSPEIVPPPPELAEKHFDDWTLAFMKSERFNKLEENQSLTKDD